MTVFNINLIKDEVIPVRNRMAGFYAMAAYQLLFGVLLTVTTFWGTIRVTKAIDQRRVMDRLELQFEEAYPGQSDIIAYAENLEEDMFTSAANLEAIEKMLNRQTHLARVLMGLALPLPLDIHIIKFDLSGKTKRLKLDIAVPVNRRDGSLTPGEIIGMWENIPDVKRHLDGLKSDVSERQVVNGQAFYIFRFSGNLRKGTTS